MQAVALEHCTLGCASDPIGPSRSVGLARTAGLAEALRLQLGDQEVQRLLDDRREFSARVAVRHQVGREFELFLQLGPRSELNAVAVSGEWLDAPTVHGSLQARIGSSGDGVLR